MVRLDYGVGVCRTIRNLWLAFKDNARIKVVGEIRLYVGKKIGVVKGH